MFMVIETLLNNICFGNGTVRDWIFNYSIRFRQL